MLINLSEVMKNLEGESLKAGEKDLTVGRAIGEILTGGTSTDPLRSYVLAKKIVGEDGEVDLDQSDVDFLKTAIEANQTYLVIVKGQLLTKFVAA